MPEFKLPEPAYKNGKGKRVWNFEKSSHKLLLHVYPILHHHHSREYQIQVLEAMSSLDPMNVTPKPSKQLKLPQEILDMIMEVNNHSETKE